jgi:PIN domain nuclease of toxin-antitoxin system
MLSSPERIRRGARTLLEDADNVLHLSAVSSWEIAIKYRLGKLSLPVPPSTFVPTRMLRDGIVSLAVEHHHALAVADLPDHHRDPFDRLLVAQAKIEGMTLFTADRQLRAYEVDTVFV